MSQSQFRGLFLVSITALLLSACGGGSGANAVPSTSTVVSFSSAVAAAEASGAIPKLDQSASLLGPDIDGNGVRDDIDVYINSLPASPVQKAALRQEASVLGKSLVIDANDPVAVATSMNQLAAAVSCEVEAYGDKQAPDMEKFVVNTKIRFDAYMKVDKAAGGKTWAIPAKGVGCAP